MLTPITDHGDQAIKRLLSQFANSTNLQSAIRALIVPVQELEDVLDSYEEQTALATAVGVQLDGIGSIVGLARTPGDGDDSYRMKLMAQIKINTSDGQPEQAIQTFQLFTGATQVRLFELYPAEVLVESPYNPPDQDTVNTILNIMHEVLPAGVRCYGMVVYDPTMPFTYAGVMNPDFGYGPTSGPGGGKYGTVKTKFAPFAYAGTNVNNKGYGSYIDPLIGGKYAS